jgi:hypothetical protein
MAPLREQFVRRAYEHAVRAGNVPRFSYAHYFLEAEGIHSRLHLQNFFSTFWPDVDASAVARIRVFATDGRELGTESVELAPFGSLFLEAAELLDRLGASEPEGLVAADLEPPEAVRAQLGDLPAPDVVHLNTPFWMSYRDADDNYMYVHSIDTLGGEVHGTSAPLQWHLTRARPQREAWRSWRLLDVELLDELQIVTINHGSEAGSTSVAIYGSDGACIWSEAVTLDPRQLRRVKVPAQEIARWLADGIAQVRIGLDPLLTANGKPYVIMRYGHGPLSLHHG